MKEIIGNGDIAEALQETKKDLLFFASGISNSLETRESEYQREKDLLLKQDKSRHIVYFSSLAVFEKNTRYFKHKREMEDLVKKEFPKYTIVRLGNITWSDKNPHTLINSLRNKVKKGEKFEIRDEYKYIVDKEEFLYWVNMIPEWNCEMNIVGKRMKVVEVVKEYVL